jgi:hypothetical protein
MCVFMCVYIRTLHTCHSSRTLYIYIVYVCTHIQHTWLLMQSCHIYAYIHTYTHTYTHTFTHAYMKIYRMVVISLHLHPGFSLASVLLGRAFRGGVRRASPYLSCIDNVRYLLHLSCIDNVRYLLHLSCINSVSYFSCFTSIRNTPA